MDFRSTVHLHDIPLCATPKPLNSGDGEQYIVGEMTKPQQPLSAAETASKQKSEQQIHTVGMKSGS